VNFEVLASQFGPLVFQGLALGLTYSLIALGYTMVYGVLRLINFANSEVFMLGTFATMMIQFNIFGRQLSEPPLKGLHLVLVLFVSLVGASIACAIVAVLVELVAYRRLRNRGASRLSSLISAIGVSIFLAETVRLFTQSRSRSAPRVLEKTSLAEFWGINFRTDTVLTIVSAIFIYLILDRFVATSHLGKGIRAVSMSEENSLLMGVNLNRVITYTFAIGGLTTGAAAFFFTTTYENTVFNVGFSLGIAAFTAAILGGIGNIRGAFYGGIALGLLEQFASAVLGSQWRAVTVFVVLVLVLLVRPNGIFGEAVQQTRT
jgi:branched-chain amino acid transport system permease protein